MNCIACELEHTTNYCPNCGENSQIEKITFASTSTNFFRSVTNMDTGFLYNIKNLTIRPSKFIHNYLSGQRKKILNPFLYLFACLTIYIFLTSFIDIPHIETPQLHNGEKVVYDKESLLRIFETLPSHQLNYAWCFSVVFLSLTTSFMYMKYNIAEHVTLCAFIIGHATLLTLPVIALTKTHIINNLVFYLIISILIMIVFYNPEKKIKSLIKAILCVFLFRLMIIFSAILFNILLLL